MMCPVDAHVAPSPGVRPGLPAVRLRLAGDERLARLAGAGDEAAFAVLFQRFHQPLYRYCRSLLGNDADAQDALQTTFTQALIALREDRRTAPVRPWLYRIAHNESVSLLRRRRPAQELPADAGGPGERSPDEVMEARVRLATLVADLRDLPDRQRGALVMRELSGLPHEEIAAAFGISVGAAKQTVLEAPRSLQEFSEGRSMACEGIQRIISDGDRRALRGRRVRAHLRECSACRTFAEAIPARGAELRALAPALPGATAAGLLARITGAGTGHGGGGAGVAAGATTKAMGLAASAKMVSAGAAVVVAAAVGAGEIHHLASRTPSASDTRASAVAPAVATRPGAVATGFRAHRARGMRAAPITHAAPVAVRPTPRKSASVGHRARRLRHHTVAAAGTAAAAVDPPFAHGAARAVAVRSTGQGAAHRAAATSGSSGSVGSGRRASAPAPRRRRQTGQTHRAGVRTSPSARGSGSAHTGSTRPVAGATRRPVAGTAVSEHATSSAAMANLRSAAGQATGKPSQ